MSRKARKRHRLRMQREAESKGHARQEGQAATGPGPSDGGGRGDSPNVGSAVPIKYDPPLTPVQENQIISRMIHFDRVVWPFVSQDYIDGVETTRRNMKSQDGRVSNRATSNFLKMTDQNLKVKDGEKTPEGSPVNLNINLNGVSIDLNHASVDDLRKLPRPELVRLYRDTLREDARREG